MEPSSAHPLLDGSSWDPKSPAFTAYSVLVLATASSLYVTIAKPFAPRTVPSGSGPAARTATSRLRPTLYEAGTSAFLSTKSLCLWRALACIYIVAIGVHQISELSAVVFKFYTVWNWWLLALYFGCSAVASLQCLQHQPSAAATAPAPSSRGPHQQAPQGEDAASAPRVDGGSLALAPPPAASQPTSLAWLCATLFSINATTVLIVDVVCWLVLYPMLAATKPRTPELERTINRLLLSFTSYNQHGFNAVMIYADLFVNRHRVPFHAVGPLGLWSLTYSVWANVWYAWTGKWLYPFLDVRKSYAPVAYLGLYLFHWVVFGVVALLYKAKGAIVARATRQGGAAGAAASRKPKAE